MVVLTVQLHPLRQEPVQQMKDAGGIAVDEGGSHADDLVRCADDLSHGVPLAAVVVVLVQLVAKDAVYLPFHLLLDVAADGEPPNGPHRGIKSVRVAADLLHLLLDMRVFCPQKIIAGKAPVNEAETSHLDPFGLHGGGSQR